MNKKGEIGIGFIVLTFITILVGVILFTAISQEVGKSNTLIDVTNSSFTWTNNTASYLPNFRSVSGLVLHNLSGGVTIPAANYTTANNVINPTTGDLAFSITPIGSKETTGTWNWTGTGQPLTYIPNSGARSVAGLIAIFFALAIVIVAISPTVKESMGYR